MYIKPGAMLGMLGGGQLGRMFAMAAQQMGYRVTVLDPAIESPAANIAERHLQADYLDYQALDELGSTCAAVTIEFENVPAQALRYLAQRCVVSPDAESVSIAQNRILEKQFLVENGFPVVPFAIIPNERDISHEVDASLFPGILKISQFGYDGKGQIQIENRDVLAERFADLGSKPCVLEKRLPLAHEISVILARDIRSQITFFPVPENKHVQGILDTSIVPTRLPDRIVEEACEIARQVAMKLNYIGVLCVEFFILDDDRILINEIAPRPHNSGHYSLDACITSQFEQQVRVLCGLPHGSTKQVQAAIMINMLGNLWQNGEPAWDQILRHPQAKLHLYGKREAKPGRKMGHFTVLADSVEEALLQARHIRHNLQLPTQHIPGIDTLHYDNRNTV
ncbi:5-(carboxyamino)imidazole ribonucleotide synthase [Nitrosomonas sp. HPC101]|uniref:5-(carboxyamino)imidazole ribonucleotide synthase n=1 Tax=Nitrosomonas sp. HPC101 TaxID=1658667 RepID=UPI00137133EF|nr:5-(carboxyamino)imidazole ribonucleotide synthase [Nitrosomonas sp. HPC101]MXS86417.1 5-(carboxyamino)imidazole ribonucleotide synthase [Nitrosomonas sp. HPC101]